MDAARACNEEPRKLGEKYIEKVRSAIMRIEKKYLSLREIKGRMKKSRNISPSLAQPSEVKQTGYCFSTFAIDFHNDVTTVFYC